MDVFLWMYWLVCLIYFSYFVVDVGMVSWGMSGGSVVVGCVMILGVAGGNWFCIFFVMFVGMGGMFVGFLLL